MEAPAFAASVPSPPCSSLVTYAMPAGAPTVWEMAGMVWVGWSVRAKVLDAFISVHTSKQKLTGREVGEHRLEGGEEQGDVADPELDAALEDACVGCICVWC